jgi:serpin B
MGKLKQKTFFSEVSSLSIVAVVLLSACSSPADNSADTPNPIANVSRVFADSDVVNERYGTATTRNLVPQIDEGTQSSIVNSINEFSFTMHRAVSANKPNEGSILSGFSAALALSLSSAATGGDTYTALTALLGLDVLPEDDAHDAINALSLALRSRSNDDLVLHVANRAFVKPALDLQTQFLDRATADYGAPVTEADFRNAPKEVADQVNNWVSEQTDGFVPTIIDEFEPETVFVLLNAIFLDARWQRTYKTTGEKPFNNIEKTISVVTNFGGTSRIAQQVTADLTAFELPYGGGELALLILMPNSIEEFEASLSVARFKEIINSLEFTYTKFDVPNWQQSSQIDLVEILSPLGLPTNPWNFERLVDDGVLLDVFARQQAKIEVDENGTRAAAVTSIEVGVTSIPPEPEIIVIDRPFIYLLRDRTSGVVLFSGRVVTL